MLALYTGIHGSRVALIIVNREMNKTTIATFIIFFLLPGCYHYYDSLNEITTVYPEEVQAMYDYCVDKWGEDSCPEINLFLKQHQERRVYTNYFLFNGEIFAHEIYEDCVATFSTSTCPSLISYQERNLPDGWEDGFANGLGPESMPIIRRREVATEPLQIQIFIDIFLFNR